MRILVTGGAGFIGSHLIRHMIGQPEVEQLVNVDSLTYAGNLQRLADTADHPKYHLEIADIRDPSRLRAILGAEQITHIVHLAAETHVDRSITGPPAFIETNILGTFNLLEACRDLWKFGEKRNRFLHVSTDEVFGSVTAPGQFDELSRYAPNSPYSATKASADLLVRAYGHTYGLPVLITNSANNYGPWQDGEKLIPRVVKCVATGERIPVYGNGRNVRDWIHVQDHANALWTVLRNGQIGHSYCIGAENEWPNIELVELICDLVDEHRSHATGTARRLISFVQDRAGHDWRYAVNSTRIRNELGWRCKVDFRTGLRDAVKWYLAHYR